jgi:hypothetical protein
VLLQVPAVIPFLNVMLVIPRLSTLHLDDVVVSPDMLGLSNPSLKTLLGVRSSRGTLLD